MGDTRVGAKRFPTNDGRDKNENREGAGSNKIGSVYVSIIPKTRNDLVQVFNAIPNEIVFDEHIELYGKVTEPGLKHRGIGLVPTNFLGLVATLRQMVWIYTEKIGDLPSDEAQALAKAIKNYHYFVKEGKVSVDGRVVDGEVMSNTKDQLYMEDKYQWEYWWNFVETPFIVHREIPPLGVMYGESSPYGFDQSSSISTKRSRVNESNHQLINLMGDWYMNNLVSPREKYALKPEDFRDEKYTDLEVRLSHFFKFTSPSITTVYNERYSVDAKTKYGESIVIHGIRPVPVCESYVGELDELFSLNGDYNWKCYHPISHNRGEPRDITKLDVVKEIEESIDKSRSKDPFESEDGDIAKTILKCQRELSSPYAVDLLTN